MTIEHILTPSQIATISGAYPTQADAARAVGCSLRTYTRILKGECRQGKTVLLAQALEMGRNFASLPIQGQLGQQPPQAVARE